ncbi:multicopper oxidase family protein [Actinacidiphila acididurans]|uniref:Multicopper oxidase family protein n=1 Tax=Actinacidiphila acididurans TaxID=2784346 RepID=A0ABS2U3N8_9ACTN|nr:multicopper oxidase family protein [Actinacidiphila acididurans]MBM9510223.1 multicopper oxidase family protein [Actinacidiphila acididurans]
MNGIDRRSVLLAGLGVAAGAGTLGAAGPDTTAAPHPDPTAAAAPAPAGTTGTTGQERRVQLGAAPATVDLGAGITTQTWAFDGLVPGRELRLTAGDTLVAELANRLPDPAGTAVHWHGLAVPNAMDGAPPVTQRAVGPGQTFTYRFTAATPGTYFFHPHIGVQLDRGLYGALIIEDPHEPLAYDDEWVVVIDDWLDGINGATPDQVLADLTTSAGASTMADGMRDGGPGTSTGRPGGQSGAASSGQSGGTGLLGSPGGSVTYPYHLINGRVPADPAVYTGTAGHRVRLRLVNAGSDTAYRVALGGHRMTVTHTDGYPVEHLDTDAILVAMGERYDVLVTLGDGVFPLVAQAEGKTGSALALIRTGAGAAPAADVRPAELSRNLLTAHRLSAAGDVRLPTRPDDVTYQVRLTGSMARYDWSINDRRFDMADPTANPFQVAKGQRVRLDFANRSDMWHPMHLHGHTFQLGTAGTGARKDTVAVLPRRTISVRLDADNPGKWMLHCHNVYHGETGMMSLLTYTT